MAFQHVILALLESGPSHGWQMKSRIEAALGPEYGGLNRGYIYEVIHKMEREGTITSQVESQAGMRPDRSVHVYVAPLTPGRECRPPSVTGTDQM